MAIGFWAVSHDLKRHYISELGAVGAPTAFAANFGVFVPTGLMALITVSWLAISLPRQLRAPVLLLLGLAVGNLGAALFPCDRGCPAQGTMQQGWHNLIGLAQYLSGGVGLIWLGQRMRHAGFVAAGVGVLVCLWLMGGPGAEWRGLWQRTAEVMLYCSLPLLARRFRDPD